MKGKKNQYWLRSGTFAMILNVQTIIFSFGGFYFLVHLLDKTSFGVWSLFLATVTFFDMFRGGLVQSALIQFLSFSKPEEESEILSASFSMSGLVMIICIAVNAALAGYLADLWHYPPLAKLFYLYTIVYLLNGILYQFQWIEQGKLSFKGILVSTTIKQAGYFLYLAICFIRQQAPSLTSLIYVTAIFTGVAVIVQYFYVRQWLGFAFTRQYQWMLKMFHYGKYVLGTSISGIITNTINQMMLGALMSPATAGVYNVAIKITNLADLPTNALGSIVFPQSSKRFALEGEEASKYLYEKSVGTILAMLIPFVLVIFIFPAFVIHVIAGKQYLEAVHVIQVTMITCLFNPFARMFGTILDSIGKTKYNFGVIILFTCVELVLNYFFIRQFHLMGAIYATLLANIIFFVVMQSILRRELGVKWFHAFVYAYRFYPEFYATYIRPRLKKRNA